MPEDAAAPERLDLSTCVAVTRDCLDRQRRGIAGPGCPETGGSTPSLVASVPGVS